METLSIAELMQQSGVAFGTSGARGLSAAITDRVAFAYTLAFLQHLKESRQLETTVSAAAVAGDLRPSTPRIMAACLAAVQHFGLTPENLGFIPSPAAAYYGIRRNVATIMVTGSHIPADRNGIKFNTALGEITKADEIGIRRQVVALPENLFSQGGHFIHPSQPVPAHGLARALYIERYLDAFPPGFLQGRNLAVYQHSAVGREILVEIYERLGAKVFPVGLSNVFVPVDTEAIRSEDRILAREWAAQEWLGKKLDAILSSDGDSDRPLVADEQGNWLSGDVLGIMVAHYLRADAVVNPVSCSTALEKSGLFRLTKRTKIGSPYVIAAMEESIAAGARRVVGYEANGGFLLANELLLFPNCKPLPALPTRDAVITHLAILGAAGKSGKKISELRAELPACYTASDRLQEFPSDLSRQIIAKLSSNNAAITAAFTPAEYGSLEAIDLTDGLRMTFSSGAIIHLRPSGNAPEFRCYVENCDDPAPLLRRVLAKMETWR